MEGRYRNNIPQEHNKLEHCMWNWLSKQKSEKGIWGFQSNPKISEHFNPN